MDKKKWLIRYIVIETNKSEALVSYDYPEALFLAKKFAYDSSVSNVEVYESIFHYDADRIKIQHETKGYEVE